MPGATDHIALADQAATTYQQDHRAGRGRSLADIVHEITEAATPEASGSDRSRFEREVLDAARALLAKERPLTKAEIALPVLEALDSDAETWQANVASLDGYDAERTQRASARGDRAVGFVDGSTAHYRPDLQRWVPAEHPDTTRPGPAGPLAR